VSSREIERKFLVDPDEAGRLAGSARGQHRIEQAYVAVDDEREVRLRAIDGERGLLTVKSHGELERDEFEIELEEEQFRALSPLLETKAVAKTRYLLDHDGHTIELDVYSGDLEGLAVAEVEFESRKDAEAFEPPDWLGRDVTGDTRYKNRNLAGCRFADLPAATGTTD